MAKRIDLTKSVYELTKEYPELVTLMSGLGFSEITKSAMLNSVGKLTTIPNGAKMKGISMEAVITALRENGFEPVQAVETAEASDNRAEQLKEYLRRLGEGEDIERVRADFVDKFSEVEASEIMEAEQRLLKEGIPLSEVQRLCDVHSALFHGTTTEEKAASADYSDKNAKAAKLENIVGHPLYTFKKENEALSALLNQYNTTGDKKLLSSIRELAIHYAKKGDLLYPHLKVKYGISGPADVMWTVDDEIRDEFADLMKKNEEDADWNARLCAVLKRVEEMIYKEQNILFPICAVNFTESEWFSIYQDAKDYAVCFGVEREKWDMAEQVSVMKMNAYDGEIVMPGGHMTIEQLTALLNTIPLEISFIDADNVNRFFNEGPKVFKRPGMAIDREVFSCHPPKIEPMVRAIINDFRNGKRDSVPVWMEKGGHIMLVTYMAVRDKNGNYLGTAELVQDMEFAKEHFKR